MDFSFTEEERMIETAAQQFAADRLAPLAARLDRGEGREEFLDNLRELARSGFSAVAVSEAFGGSNAGVVGLALVLENMAYACAATASALATTNMVCTLLEAIGTEDQKRRHIPPLADGRHLGASICLTESGAGSDAAAIRTRARRDGSEYVIDGSKQFISLAEIASVFAVCAVTDPDAPKGKGISCFLVEADTPGLIVGKKEVKHGQKGYPTNEVYFDGCRVPASAMMGKENQGFQDVLRGLKGARIGIAALSLGIARAAMDAAKAYVVERQQFGQTLSQFQGVQWMIADREVDLAASRLLVLNAAALKDRGKDFSKAASMAKLFASEAAQRATDTAMQLHGGVGYMADFPVERFARDARLTRIYEGASEIQRLIIARETMGGMG